MIGMTDSTGYPIIGMEGSYGVRSAEWETTADINQTPATPEEMWFLLDRESDIIARFDYTPTTFNENDVFGHRYLRIDVDAVDEIAHVRHNPDGLPMDRKLRTPHRRTHGSISR